MGMYAVNINSPDELINYLTTLSIYCVTRNGKYINFKPLNLMKFFSSSEVVGEYYEDGKYNKIKFTPKLSDIEYLRSFKFEDLTHRGTIEYRSCCCQPIKDSMSVAAFHLGIVHKIDQVEKLLNNNQINYGYSLPEIRELFLKRDIPDFVNKESLRNFIINILDIAKEGLIERGNGEEVFIDCLFKRAEKLESPALKFLRDREAGISEETLIKEYAEI